MSVRKAMAYKEVELTSVEGAINDPMVVMEQKVDGTRSLVVVNFYEDADPVITFLARNGGALTHSAAKLHFPKIRETLRTLAPQFNEGSLVLDGEIMFDQGIFVVFDLPEADLNACDGPTGVHVDPSMEYRYRLLMRDLLVTLLGEQSVIRPVRSAITAQQKRDLFNAIQAMGGEGVMLKRLDSKYEPGVRVKHSVKVKFVKTADVVVTHVNRGRNEAGREVGNIEFGVNLPDGEFLVLGRCSVIGKPHVVAGDVIEVAYLYRGPGERGGLVQPRMMRVREDKEPHECTVDQFPAYSKAVV